MTESPEFGDSQAQPKKKLGAPFGNRNGFRNGQTYLARAKKRRLRVRQRRIVLEVMSRLTEDIGGSENISEAQRIIVAIVAKQCGRLDKVHRCYDTLMRKHKELQGSPGALHKMDTMLGPMEQRIVSNLRELGLK